MGETAHESQVAGHKASRQEAGHAGQATYLPWRPHSCCEGPAAVFKKRAAAHPRQTCLLPAPSGSPRGRREKQRLTVTTYQASPALGRAGPPGGTRARSPLCHGAGRGVPRLSPLIYHPPDSASAKPQALGAPQRGAVYSSRRGKPPGGSWPQRQGHGDGAGKKRGRGLHFGSAFHFPPNCF